MIYSMLYRNSLIEKVLRVMHMLIMVVTKSYNIFKALQQIDGH